MPRPCSQITVGALKERGAETERERGGVAKLLRVEKGPFGMELKVREIRKKKHLLYMFASQCKKWCRTRPL